MIYLAESSARLHPPRARISRVVIARSDQAQQPIYYGRMGHAADVSTTGATVLERLENTGAADVATTLQALSTASRLRILACLRQGPQSATALATASGMQKSACSHQLRLLRNLGLVTADRQGRSIIYSLHDDHVGELLEQALFHVNLLRLNARS